MPGVLARTGCDRVVDIVDVGLFAGTGCDRVVDIVDVDLFADTGCCSQDCGCWSICWHRV